MIKFRLSDIRFTFDFTFFALFAVLSLFRFELAITLISACLIHEIGHIIAIYSFNGKISDVHFSALGIKIIPKKSIYLPYCKEIIILFSGPFFNFAFFFISMIISSSLIEFAYLNLALGVFNLLPFSRLDGGSILLIILENIFPEKNTHQIIKIPAIIILLCNIAYIIIIRDINIINIVFILYPISEITDK